MSGKKGFTLIVITIAIIALGALLAIAIPIYISTSEQAMAQEVVENFKLITKAENVYYLKHGFYCTHAVPKPQLACAEDPSGECAVDLPSINCNLSLNIPNNGYSYSVAPPPASAVMFQILANKLNNGGSSVQYTYPPVGNGPDPCCVTSLGNNCPSNIPMCS